MAQHSLNYDRISNEYNQRYPASQHWERGRALLDLSQRFIHGTFLEVGSGTGFWLNLLSQITSDLFAFDYSFGMLRQAQAQPAPLKLSRGSAIQLPYANNTFDLVYTVDAIHHFGDHRAYMAEAFRVLKPGGALATIGHDPHAGTTNWYIYEYFESVYDTDLRRYPSSEALLKVMQAHGFHRISSQRVEHIRNVHVGDSVLRDPFLKQNATSQLALLSSEAYEAGLQRIKQTIVQAAMSNEKVVFMSDIQVYMLSGFKPIA